MSLLAQAKIDALSPEELWATNADTPSQFSDYLGLSYGQGVEGSLRGVTGAVGPDYQPPMSGGIFGEPALQQPSGTPRLTEEQWKASKNYRPEIPYDPGMTEARAEFLKQQFDSRRWRDDVYRRYQGGLAGQAAGIAAMLAGGSLSPENFIPILGPASRAYMAARLGKVGAYTAAGSIEGAVGNLAVAPYVYQGLAAQGEDVGLEDVALDVAFGAIIGGAFGAGAGGLARARAMREAAVSGRGASVHTATDALNLAADAVERGDVPDVGRIVQPEAERVGGMSREMFVAARQAAPDEPGIDVWHGSPHKFDKFSMEKVGTGEGAQAYGHGLYFAANPEVARNYQKNLSATVGNTQTAMGAADRAIQTAGGDRAEAIRSIDANIRDMQNSIQAMEARGMSVPDAFRNRIANEYEPAKQLLESGYQPGGSLYKVRLAVNPERMLDWDKPIGEQTPHVKEALQRFAAKEDSISGLPEGMKAGDWLETIESLYGSRHKAKVSKALRDAGIPGVKYLDGGSRADGQGTRNYVVFDDSLARITEIDGRPLPPEPEPESVTTATARVGKDTPELQQFAEDMGLEDSSTVDLDLNELRRSGALTAADEAELEAAGDLVKQANNVAEAYSALSTCVLRHTT